MIETFHFNEWIIEVDLLRTSRYYANHNISEDCNCKNCKNYRLHCEYISSDLLSFFHRLGVDPKKEGEFMEFGPNNDGDIHYMGFYHLVGKIKTGPRNVNEKWKEIDLIKIDNFEFGFNDEGISCVPRDFPEPIIQLEFCVEIPWRLEEKYDL